jgi:hypothetical protein
VDLGWRPSTPACPPTSRAPTRLRIRLPAVWEYASARGWKVADELVVQDAGISGASRHERPQFLELMARIPEWDVSLVQGLLAARVQRGRPRVDLQPPQVGQDERLCREPRRSIDDLGSQVQGVIAAEYLDKLTADTHAGSGAGQSAGSLRAAIRLPHRGAPERSSRPSRPQHPGRLPLPK